jgi:hypothetical protein
MTHFAYLLTNSEAATWDVGWGKGIISIGGFIRYSRDMMVLWDSTYVERHRLLWAAAGAWATCNVCNATLKRRSYFDEEKLWTAHVAESSTSNLYIIIYYVCSICTHTYIHIYIYVYVYMYNYIILSCVSMCIMLDADYCSPPPKQFSDPL